MEREKEEQRRVELQRQLEEAKERERKRLEEERRKREKEERDKRKAEEIRKKLQQLNPCPAGFSWFKVNCTNIMFPKLSKGLVLILYLSM